MEPDHEEPTELFFPEYHVHEEDQNHNQFQEAKAKSECHCEVDQSEEQSDHGSEDQSDSQSESEEYQQQFQQEVENEKRNFLEWGVTVPEAINHYIKIMRKHETDEQVNCYFFQLTSSS